MTKQGIKEEKKALANIGLSSIPFSGALWDAKSDGLDKHFRGEVKSTKGKSFTLQKAIWRKIEREALETSKIPLMVFTWPDLDLVLLDSEVFKELYEVWKEKMDSEKSS